MWHWNNTLKVSLQTNLLNLINITIPLDILSWMLLIRCDQVNLLSIGLPKCLLCNFFFFIVPISFWCSVLWWLFFYSSKIVQGSLCALGINPPLQKHHCPLSCPVSPPPSPTFLGSQLIVQFASAACPNLKLENPIFLGRKMKFRKLPTCGYKGR